MMQLWWNADVMMRFSYELGDQFISMFSVLFCCNHIPVLARLGLYHHALHLELISIVYHNILLASINQYLFEF